LQGVVGHAGGNRLGHHQLVGRYAYPGPPVHVVHMEIVPGAVRSGVHHAPDVVPLRAHVIVDLPVLCAVTDRAAASAAREQRNDRHQRPKGTRHGQCECTSTVFDTLSRISTFTSILSPERFTFTVPPSMATVVSPWKLRATSPSITT